MFVVVVVVVVVMVVRLACDCRADDGAAEEECRCRIGRDPEVRVV